MNTTASSFLTQGEHPVAHLLEELEKAAGDPRVKGIVLRINSPGGSVTASELMHQEIIRFRQTGKPVVAMMMDVAASGGYFIACAADEIFACKSTVTGSIGVIMQTFDVTGTMQRIGMKADAIRSGAQKGAGSPFQELSPEQRDVLAVVVGELYEQFVEVVDAGRPGLEGPRIRELADGRVYTSRQALEHGLIDRIGTMADAVERVKELANISSAKVVAYSRPYRHVPNYYARMVSPNPSGNVNLLNVDFGSRLQSHRPPFMYLWTHP